MKKLFIGFLFIVSLQMVSGRDTINSNSSSKTACSWLIGVQLGSSTLLNSSANYELSMLYYASPKETPNYKKRPINGWVFKGDLYYLFSKYFGLGVNYSFTTFSSHNDFTMRSHHYEYLYMEMDQKQYIHFAGPSVIFRQWLNKNQKLQLTETASIGYIHYRDELRNNSYTNGYYPYTRVLVEGNTWGMNAYLSLDYYPVSWLSIGANIGFAYSRLNEVDVSSRNTGARTTTIELDHQPLSLLDYSLNIRFYIFE